MTPVESLPPDQKAVLELVLRRGRTYDEIAQLLSIDRAGVRQRALSALDALGPDAGVPAERRALITDYLLGALPPRVTEQVRQRLADSASERAWARVIAAELEPMASGPLPEIPSPSAGQPASQPQAPAAVQEPAPAQAPAPSEPAEPVAPEPAPERQRGRRRRAGKAAAAGTAAGVAEESGAGARPARLGPRPPIEPGRERPASRRGGRVVLTAAVIIVLAIVLSVVLSSGGSKKPAAQTTTGTTLTTAKTTSTSPTTTTPAGSQVLAQINLNPPSGGKAKGIAEVLREAGRDGLAVVATGLAPNTSHDAYAVWLYNSPTDSHLLGFVSPAVGSNGRLQTAGALPSNASHFQKLLVTLETKASPTAPGTIVLEGALKGLS